MIINFDIPNAVASRVVNALADKFGYSDTITDTNGNFITNTETKAAFVKRMQILEWKQIVKNKELASAVTSVTANASSKIDSDINIT